MNSYLPKLQTIKEEFQTDSVVADNPEALTNLETKYLGRQGLLNQFLKDYPPKGNPTLGKEINELKQQIITFLKDKRDSLQDNTEKIDLSLPFNLDFTGSRHLIPQAIEQIQDIFTKIGFNRRRYPEIDTDWYYAEGLNIPKDHPARDDQETFYLENGFVLTAHTSNGQLHEMETHKPPIRMINIGKTYRRQADTSHSPMFHQFEGLVVDKGISIANLISITDYFAKSFFGPERQTRLRPHHFQFTEPSFEIDISCELCGGMGKVDQNICKMCKSGWLELGGAGMVHRNVLKNGGLDPDVYSGFAFGWGVERVLLMRSGLKIADLRTLFTDDYNFLNQFK
jgi:phenylalanyl-tRNA synthetase alpha chain